MPLSLLDEQDTHFNLHDGEESFPVAKYGLDETQIEKIRALPKGYADGGMVGPVADVPAYDPTGLYEPSAPEFQVAPSAPYDELSLQTGKSSGFSMEAGEPGGLKPETIKTLGLTVPETSLEQPVPPGAQGAGAAPGYLGYMDQIMGKGMQAKAFELPSEYAQGYQTMIDASKRQAEASAQAAEEQARIYDQAQKEIQLAEIARQTQERAVQQDLDKIRNDIATQKIDPTRVWSNMSTGNRVLAGISIFLGGVAGGMQGTDNKALKIINDAIDRDIDTQKSELGKKQNLLAINLQKYRNIQDAAAATKAQLMAVTQAQVQSTAAKAGSKQALAAAQMFQGQTELEMGKLKMQLAASQMTQNKLTDPRGLTPQEALKMSQDIKDTLVQLPNGQYYPAFNAQSAKNIKDVQADIYNVMNQIQMAKKFMESGYTLPATDRNAKAEMLSQNILLAAKSDALFKLGALTNADIDLIKPLIPDVGSFFQERNKAKLQNLENILMGKLNAYYSANLPGLNPSGRQIRETSVFGGR